MSSQTPVSHASLRSEQHPPLAMKRIWWVGLLAVVASSVVSEVIRIIAVTVLPISPDFVSLQWARPISFSAVSVILATIVFALVARFARHPLRTYHVIALVALILSFGPDLGLRLHMVPTFLPSILAHALAEDATPAAVAVLAAMHVTTYLITVGLLTTLTRVRSR